MHKNALKYTISRRK